MKMEEKVLRKQGQCSSLESVTTLLRSVVDQWCYPELKKKDYYGDTSEPLVTYEVCFNEEKHILIRIKVRYGPFGTERHVTERKHYSVTHITSEELLNQLFHTLTFKGSPFYFYKNGFRKYMEVVG
jgi:hypothetical protein